jgi:hypothetical protein
MSSKVLIAGNAFLVPVLRYKPKGNRAARRCLFLATDILKEYDNDTSACVSLAGRGPIKSVFEHWTLGQRIYGRKEKGKFVRGAFMCPLDPPPPDIWEIRVTQPTNQVRIFGLFTAPNHFLATNMHTRRFLDEDAGWAEAMKRSAEIWNGLFPNSQPFRGTTVHDYITEKCDDFPITTKAPKSRRTK